MKKGLLLSIAASAVMFAGGDIAPVQPAAPASADFWGQLGFAYQAQDVNNGGFKFGDKENNAFSATAVLGVEKELGMGFGFGAEVAGWTDFGLNIADNARVMTGDQTDAELSQLYLTYSFGNTAIKAGRQALPSAVTPWAWSDRSAGVLDWTYEGLVVANTDLPDTTLVAAWVANVTNNGSTIHIGKNKAGLFMLSAINKSLANTTLTLTGYYVPKFDQYNLNKDIWSVWGSAVSKFDNITAGLQVAYVDGGASGTDATFGVAGKVGGVWGDFDATLIAGYINDGSYSLVTAGVGIGSSAFWTDNEEAGDIAGDKQTAVLLKAGYKLPYGKLYGSVGYWNFGSGDPKKSTLGARLGYKFTVAGVNAKVEYRYRDRDMRFGPNQKRQRVRVEAYYKF